VYFSRHADDHDGIRLWEIELETGRLIGPEHKIWPGFEDDLCEAPHIYKINGWYYLLVAEGGTHRGHMACIGRSQQVTGPYESCPHNPILSHRAKVAEPIQATGHADLVQAHDGAWWMVFLGIRQVDWRYHHLGRETFLAPVTWTTDGWPVVNSGRKIELEMGADLLTPHAWPPAPKRDDFDSFYLALPWNFRRCPAPRAWSLSERPGWLTLHGGPNSLDDPDAPVFLGRRQQHFDCTATTLLEFDPHREGEEAGLAVYMDEQHHYEIALRRGRASNEIIVRKRIGDLAVEAACEAFKENRVLLRVAADAHLYAFSYSVDGKTFHPLAKGLARYLSSEVAGGFAGVYFALYVTGNGKPGQAAVYFDWFDYRAE
jgi:alpha-N-arabinofuranosidase